MVDDYNAFRMDLIEFVLDRFSCIGCPSRNFSHTGGEVIRYWKELVHSVVLGIGSEINWWMGGHPRSDKFSKKMLACPQLCDLWRLGMK